MTGTEILDFLDEFSFFLLSGEHLVQQSGSDQYDSAQHDGHAGINAGNGAWKDQRDRASNSGVAEGNKNMT